MAERASPPARGRPTNAKRRATKRAPRTLREGALEPAGRDPLRHHPMREPYAKRSGGAPQESGTPETVTRRPAARRGTDHRKRG
ncbi:MAG: hypothetical protein AB7J30_21675 [Hyphomicrobium sp.]|uniref:hypothetical protein n=1 Tax=Hyphomicrobium sp. TaxID=82 RepID=UPI003D0FBB1F